MNSADIKAIGIYVVVIGSLWGLGTLFAKIASDYEIIQPKDGIECVVVSRMFNTSVDCWAK